MAQASGYLKQVLSHDENVLLIVRKHWLFLLRHVLGSILLLLLTGALAGAIYVFAIRNSPDMAPIATLVFLLVLIPFAQLIWKILVWHNHMYVITNRRVIQLSGVLNKEVVDSLLEKVNDVKTDQPLFGRIFNYGDMEILTASEIGVNEFNGLARILEFKRTMLEAKENLDRHTP
jgi:uncharacterized membrane protein YdbT with pleckstrin-like domain